MRFKVVLEPSDEGGFTALIPSLPGCISEGDTGLLVRPAVARRGKAHEGSGRGFT